MKPFLFIIIGFILHFTCVELGELILFLNIRECMENYSKQGTPVQYCIYEEHSIIVDLLAYKLELYKKLYPLEVQ